MIFCADGSPYWPPPGRNVCAPSQPPDGTCTTPPAEPEKCGDGLDNDQDGCIDNGCPIGQGECTCAASCGGATLDCIHLVQATCDPYKPGSAEVCGDGIDNNCNQQVDENCDVPDPPCGKKVGEDPILLANRSAVTTPFTDFSVQAISRLSVTRTYSSADASVVNGTAPGIFGRGWHHDWEAVLTCDAQLCSIRRGLGSEWSFVPSAEAPSLDGTELWRIYTYADRGGRGDSPGILARRPSGEFILFRTDGTEMHFQVACDACETGEYSTPRCQDALSGGWARLASVADATGNAIHFRYDRPHGILLALSDELGHTVELRNAQAACGSELVSELRYDGTRIVGYEYDGPDLARAVDTDGNVLRAYTYYEGSGGRLQAVMNEAGTAIAEFSYDVAWRAIGLVDAASNVSINYDAQGGIAVTESFQGPDGPSTSTSVRAFDRGGDVTSISDGCACGPARTFTWTNGRLTCSVDSDHIASGQEFDQAGRVTRSAVFSGTCPMPRGVTAQSREERRTYGLVRPIAYGVGWALDGVTSIKRRTPFAWTDAERTWDFDQAAKAIDPVGYTCTSVPLPVGSVVCREVENGFVRSWGPLRERHATFYSYDARGRMVRKVGPLSLDNAPANEIVPIEERTYWPDDASLARRGRLWQVKRYSSPNAAPLVTSYDYDSFGPFQVTAPDRAVTLLVKDSRGRIRFLMRASGPTELRYYDETRPRLVLTPSGAAIRVAYDGKGRMARTERLWGDPEAPGGARAVGWADVHEHDGAGNRFRSERRDVLGNTTFRQEHAFDVMRRMVREYDPDHPDRARAWTYDPAGLLISSTDGEGRLTVIEPEALGRVQSVTKEGLDASGTSASLRVGSYWYQDWSGALQEVRDPSGTMATTYGNDDFGRLDQVKNPSIQRAGVVRFTYDARGNVLRKADDVTTVNYTYDGLDRVLTVSASSTAGAAASAYTFTYDEGGAAGRLTTVRDSERTYRHFYDPAGHLTTQTISETGAPALVTGYGYDADGDLTEIRYPSGLRLRYERDPATKEVRRVLNPDDGMVFASEITHAPGGPMTSVRLGNGITVTQRFDLRYEPLSTAGGPLSIDYMTSPAGNVSTIREGGVTRTITHDFLDRLSDSPGWFSYRYDDVGNMTVTSVAGTSLQYTYSGSFLTASLAPTRTGWGTKHVFAYDQESNVSGVFLPGTKPVGACLRHDALNRLVLVGRAASPSATPGGLACTSDAQVGTVTARFKYDASNRRVVRSDAAGTTRFFVHDPAGLLLTETQKPSSATGSWTRLRDYVWLDGRPLAQVEYPGPKGTTRGYAFYFHLDHVGLPRALTNEAAQTVWSARSDPYGGVTEKTIADPISRRTIVTNLRLPGQYDERLLGSVGLQGPYYNWHRWYLPSMGRYMELDPIALRGRFNARFGPDWYGYALQNPLTWTDPWGLIPDSIRMRVLAMLARGDIAGAGEYYLLATGASQLPRWFVAMQNAYSASNRVAGACEGVAQNIHNGLKQLGQNPQLISISSTGGDFLNWQGRMMVSSGNYHQAVLVGERIYDAYTGPAGMLWPEYQGAMHHLGTLLYQVVQ